MATREEMMYTVKFGTYYNPATNHYPELYNSAVVTCDNCHTKNLRICIGANSCDLCLDCVQMLELEGTLADTRFGKLPPGAMCMGCPNYKFT